MKLFEEVLNLFFENTPKVSIVFYNIFVCVCFNNLFQRNKLDTNNIKYNYHIMIIQHNNVL